MQNHDKGQNFVWNLCKQRYLIAGVYIVSYAGCFRIALLFNSSIYFVQNFFNGQNRLAV